MLKKNNNCVTILKSDEDDKMSIHCTKTFICYIFKVLFITLVNRFVQMEVSFSERVFNIEYNYIKLCQWI